MSYLKPTFCKNCDAWSHSLFCRDCWRMALVTFGATKLASVIVDPLLVASWHRFVWWWMHLGGR